MSPLFEDAMIVQVLLWYSSSQSTAHLLLLSRTVRRATSVFYLKVPLRFQAPEVGCTFPQGSAVPADQTGVADGGLSAGYRSGLSASVAKTLTTSSAALPAEEENRLRALTLQPRGYITTLNRSNNCPRDRGT